jgi:hypothetical protein
MRPVCLTILPVSVLLLSVGCNRPATPASVPAQPAAGAGPSASLAAKPVEPLGEWTANEILSHLLTTYRQAQTYQDQAVVRLAFRQGGQPQGQEWPTAVAFQRPGKLSIHAYQATVKCDGQELLARIEDPTTNNVDGQVVVRPVPKEFRLAELASDELLYNILCSRLQRQPIQLELLIESGGLVSAFGGDVACKRLDDDKHGGQPCFRVEVPSPGGAFVFWVDQGNFLLRRLDYPAAALVPDLASDPSVSELTLLADLRGPKIGEPISAAQFTLDIPPTAKRMKTFVVPPQPLPSDLFGKQLQAYYFTRPDGGRLSDKNLAGKVAILAWYHDNPACEATLQQVSLARERLKDDAAVAFYAVATDPTSTTNDAIQKRLAEWRVELPVIRDLEAFGDKSFHIQYQPTIVVLDSRGLVQIFQTGGSPELADVLVDRVGRLKKGDDLATEIVATHAQDRRKYEELVARGGPEPGEAVELAEAVIRRRTEPTKFTIRPLWTCNEVAKPGNIVIAESLEQPPRVFVLEGWRTIAEIGAQGQVIQRHPLAIPPSAAITFVRTAIGKDGKRYFVGSSPLAPHFFVFDEAWQLTLQYPPEGNAPLHIVDLALADVGEADGTPEVLVASAGDVGVVAVALTGEVRWRNRTFPNAFSVVASPPDELGSWRILVAGEQGFVLPLNRFGHEEPPITVTNWPILRLFGGQFSGATKAPMLGLTNNPARELFVVGLTGRLESSWNYPLPAGVHQRPIDPVVSSHVLAGYAGEWWLAGPDGSIHLITEDGRLFDSFHFGAALSGIAVTKLDEQPVLWVATDNALTAQEIKLPIAAKRSREY